MKKFYTTFFVLVIVLNTNAQTIAGWNFNSNPSDGSTSTGVTTPSFGTGTFSLIGGVTSTYAGGNGGSNTNDNSALNTSAYPAASVASGTAGVQFSVSTVGFSNIIIGYNQRQSNSSSRFSRFQYTTDGTNWVTPDLTAANTTAATGTVDFVNDVFVQTVGDAWATRTVNLSAISAVNNNANFAFRIVSVFDPAGTSYVATNTTYATTGTFRFDDVEISSNATLPTILSAFTATINQGKVQLNWATASEVNTKFFNIEKSIDGVTFENINQVNAKGAGNYEAQELLQQISTFYRLKMVDKDGTYTYSKTILVAAKIAKPIISPNPVSDIAIINHSIATAGSMLSIYTMEGKKVKAFAINTNSTQSTVNVSNLTTGKYIVEILQGNERNTAILIKQ